MDANKKAKLKEAGYEIRECCALCVSGEFNAPASIWGECRTHLYDHLKHSDSRRQASVCRFGWCSLFRPSEVQVRALGRYSSFFDAKAWLGAMTAVRNRRKENPS